MWGDEEDGEEEELVAGDEEKTEAGEEEQPLSLDDDAASPELSDTNALPDPGSMFTGLASDQDWAEAAAKWAQSGFSADSMPSFIKGGESSVIVEGQESEQKTEAGQGAQDEFGQPEHTLPLGQPPGARPAPIIGLSGDEVEVSDADIMVIDDDEISEIEEPIPDAASAEPEPMKDGPSWAKQASEKMAAKRKAAEEKAKPSPAIRLPGYLSKLSHPAVLASVLGLLGLVLVALLWVFLGSGEDPESFVFPRVETKAPLTDSVPLPASYAAKSEAQHHYGLGNRYAFFGRFEDAIVEYQRATQIDLGYPHPHRAMGSLYAVLGKTTLAATAYESYLRLSPSGPDASAVKQLLAEHRSR